MLVPAKNHVLAQILPDEPKKVGSLLLPDNQKNKQIRAIVVYSRAEDYSHGDHIIYDKLRDREITDPTDNTSYVIIHEDNILAKIQ